MSYKSMKGIFLLFALACLTSIIYYTTKYIELRWWFMVVYCIVCCAVVIGVSIFIVKWANELIEVMSKDVGED